MSGTQESKGRIPADDWKLLCDYIRHYKGNPQAIILEVFDCLDANDIEVENAQVKDAFPI